MPLVDSTAPSARRPRTGMTLAEAAVLGGRTRWAGHARRVIRIADLTNDQAAAVNALVNTFRSARREAAAVVDPAAAESEGHGHDRPTG